LRTVENHLIADTAFQYVRQCARLSFTSKRVKDALATHAASTDREYRGAALLTLRRTERPVRTLEEEMGDS